MYEYQRAMNPPGAQAMLADKTRFLRHFQPFVRRRFADLETLQREPDRANELLEDPSGRLVVKGTLGQCGREVEILDAAAFDAISLTRYMDEGRSGLAEGYVTQHPDLMALSPSGLNTIRVCTELKARWRGPFARGPVADLGR